MAAWRYEISLLVLKKYFTRSLRSLVKYFSTLEEKFRISARPCNILSLYICTYIKQTILKNIQYLHFKNNFPIFEPQINMKSKYVSGIQEINIF